MASLQYSREDGRAIVEEDDAKSIAKLTPDSIEFGWCEGPAYAKATGTLFFSDVEKATLYAWSRENGCSAFRKQSNFSNGNCIDREGRLVTCEHYTRRVTRTDLTTNEMEVVAHLYNGEPFNSPNDVVVKSDGSIWFTDPDYGCTVAEGHGSPPKQDGCYVYRVSPDLKDIRTVAKDLMRPNGLCFSPDESILYVVDTGAVYFPKVDEKCVVELNWANPHNVNAYDVKRGTELEKKEFSINFEKSVPDGMRCDIKGNLYVGTFEGIQVFSPDGTILCVIRTPKRAANCCFGGEGNKTLFITATDTVWAVQCQIPGAV
eukprot:m.6746 g.6746  ORF g.6746 m.6746 type:complete len:317 (+) comp16768_c0_seq1:519-1469(+)